MSQSAVSETIVLTAGDPRGRFLGGIVEGALYPGTLVQVKAGTAPINGRHTWQAYNRDADGNRPQGPFGILIEDRLQGKTINDAYVSGDMCEVYIPLPGDELLILWSAAGTGTGDAVAVGALGIPDDGTGYVVTTTGSPEVEPFVALEALTDVTSTGTLCWVMFTGY